MKSIEDIIRRAPVIAMRVIDDATYAVPIAHALGTARRAAALPR